MKIKIELRDKDAKLGQREGLVLDKNNVAIGDAHDSTYQGRGFACHTKEWAGFVPVEDIEFV